MQDVHAFLAGLGLERYGEAFEQNAIDAQTLPDLTDADLKELGVTALGHRKKILKAAALLNSDDGQDPDPAPDPERDFDRAVGQKRQLTLMFADLVGSTELSRRLGLEDYRAVIASFQEATRAAIEAEGGYVAKYLGDGVLAYFGYPSAHEDDPERALRAGLSLIADLAGRDPPLGLRVGVETGPVVVGDVVGTVGAREHAVVGETPNLAARLQTLAAPGELVIGPRARRLLGASLQASPLGPQNLKGFSDPVEAWRVEGLTTRGERKEPGFSSPLVGRRDELGALAAAFSRLRLGEAVTLQVTGEPGMGKSRLVAEFLAQLGEEARLLRGNCAAQGATSPFYPFIDLLRRTHFKEGPLTGLIDAWQSEGLDREEQIPYLLRLLDLEHPLRGRVRADLIGARTEEAIITLLLREGWRQPTVLFINDLQWIDERSAALLDRLIRLEERPGLMILLTARLRYRPPWDGAPNVREVRLEPLVAEEGLSLLKAQLPDDGVRGEAELQAIVERAGGNPLFLEELASHLGRAEAGASGEVPETLSGLLMQRVDQLSRPARRFAETAAVAGRRFPLNLVGEDAGPDPAILQELNDARLIGREPGAEGVFRFQHALMQEVIYDSLLSETKARLHARLARRLSDLYQGREAEVAEELARHYETAGEARQAARHAYRAGCKSLELFALADAETWFGKALSLLPVETTEEEDLIWANSIVNLSQVRCWNGDFPGMVALAQTHLPRIEALGDLKQASLALTWIGEGFMHAGDLEGARQRLARAEAIALRLGDEEAAGYAQGETLWLDTIARTDEDAEAFTSRSERIKQQGEALGDHYLVLLGGYAAWVDATHRGEVFRAHEAATRLIEEGARSGYPPAACWGACMLADSEMRAGNSEQARRHAEDGKRAAACHFDRLMAELSWGSVLLGGGDSGAALQVLDQMPFRSERIGALFFGYASDAAYGRALIEEGRTAEGLAWLTEGQAHFADQGNERAALLCGLERARALVRENGLREDRRRGFGLLFGRRAQTTPQTLDELLRNLVERGKAAGMRGLAVEALLIAAERCGPVSEAEALLAEAQDLVKGLGWLALEQRVAAAPRNPGL